jgi:hypothetical protein
MPVPRHPFHDPEEPVVATVDATAAHARFLVVARMPLLAVDLEGPEPEGPAALAPGLFRTLLERGLAVMEGFYGRDLPRGARVGLTLARDELRLEDTDETRLLSVPRASVDADWLEHAARLRGSMLLVGRNLGIDPDQTPKELCDLIERATADRRVAGAIVGFAEPREGLPLLFG